MYAFTLERPATTAEAAKLAAAGAKVLAGGQTLLASMKLRLSDPGQLVDLANIKELAGIRRDGNAFVIGAMTRHAEVAANAELKAALPALAELAAHIGDRQVRAMGTLGGSVANNDPAADYPAAVLGLNATIVHHAAPDRRRRFLPGHVHHRLAGWRADHGHQLPDPAARGLHEVPAAGLALRAGGRVRGANRRRRARGGDRRRQRRVPPPGVGERADQELHARGGGRRAASTPQT